MRTVVRILTLGLLAVGLAGCPKQIPQPEIDAAEQALADLDKYKDCAPETALAAKTTMDRARALLKEERYEEAKTALLAAKKLAEKAKKDCAEKKKRDEQEAQRRKELEAQQAARQVEAPPEDEGPEGMVTVYFGFNTSDLTDETRDALAINAEYLRNHQDERIQIEGHCDDRGSTEYNLALGERRALAVKQYMTKVGIDPNRLELISFGEERMADPGTSEEAHAKNRRAEFRKVKQEP